MSVRARVLAATAIAIVLLVIATPPAWANHVVQWGIDSPAGPRDEAGASNDVVTYEVMVTLDGAPLIGWPMSVQITDAAGQLLQTLSLITDSAGTASFEVDPMDLPSHAPGVITVRLCDDDGCVYGDSTLRPSGPTATTAPSTASAPTSTDTSGTTAAPAPDNTAGSTTPRGSGGGSTRWPLLIGGGLVVMVVGAGLFFSSRPATSLPCSWGVVIVDTRGERRQKTPKGRSCGDYRLEIVTTITDPPSLIDRTTTERVKRDTRGLVADLLDPFDQLTMWVTQDLRVTSRYDAWALSPMSTVGSEDLPTDVRYLAEPGAPARRAGQQTRNVDNRAIESTRVSLRFVPSGTCKVADAHRFLVEGRSVVQLTATSACSHDGGDFSRDMVPGTVHSEWYAPTIMGELKRRTTETWFCNASFDAEARADTTVTSPQGFTYAVDRPTVGQRVTGTAGGATASVGSTIEVPVGPVKLTLGLVQAQGHNQERRDSWYGKNDMTVRGLELEVSYATDSTTKVQHKTHDITSSVWTATRVTARAATTHQLRARASADPASMDCDCEPPQIELRVGQPTSIGTVARGEDEAMLPGVEGDGDAELYFDDRMISLARPSATSPGTRHWDFHSDALIVTEEEMGPR